MKDCKTAKEQIDALKGIFLRSSSFTKLSPWRKLLNLKTTTNEKLEDHFLKFDSIIRELKEQGTELNESDKVCHLLLSLPTKFDTVVTALETVSDVKVDFVKARLLDEEMKVRTREENENKEFEIGLNTAVQPKKCYVCGSPQHFQSNCPKRNDFIRGRNNTYRGFREQIYIHRRPDQRT